MNDLLFNHEPKKIIYVHCQINKQNILSKIQILCVANQGKIEINVW